MKELNSLLWSISATEAISRLFVDCACEPHHTVVNHKQTVGFVARNLGLLAEAWLSRDSAVEVQFA